MTTRASRPAGFTSPIPVPRLEGIPDIIQPAFELGAKLQSELVCLWCHRAQAWMNLPSRIATCKTPTDIASVQGDFFDQMQHHYAQFMDGVLRDALIEQEEFAENGDGENSKNPGSETGLQRELNAA